MTWFCPRCEAAFPDSDGSRGDGCLTCTEVVATKDLKRVLHDVRQAENGCNIDDDGPCKQCAMEARKRLERILGDEVRGSGGGQ